MFYLIGLGLNLKSISVEALEALKKADKIYLEDYTVNFPYSTKELEKAIRKKIIELNREKVEKEEFLNEAKNKNIVLLVYGSPLAATTHISLILSCKKLGIKYKIIHNSSILTAVAETGLSLYKFGKTASLPKWVKNFQPLSFLDIIKENMKIKAHTLLLTDISLTNKEALEQLEQACKKKNMKLNKLIICEKLGTEKSKIYYDKIEKLKKKKVSLPFCIIVPSTLNFAEEEALKVFG